MKKKLMLLFLSFTAITAMADDVKVGKFRYAGPYEMHKPVMIDSVKPDMSRFDEKDLLAAGVSLEQVKNSTQFTDSILPYSDSKSATISLLQFNISNSSYAKTTINVKNLKNFKLFVDGAAQNAGKEITLTPATHSVVIKYLSQPEQRDTAIVSFTSAKTLQLDAMDENSNGHQLYYAEAGTKAKALSQIIPSPDGKYYIQTEYQSQPNNQTRWTYSLKDIKTNSIRLISTSPIYWTKTGHEYYKYVTENKKRKLVAVDAETFSERVLCENLPQGSLQILPNFRQCIVTKRMDGQQVNNDMRIYVHPEDRVPGWRDRSQLELFDFQTELTQPLTYGFRNVYISDISADSRYALLVTQTECIEKMRPTSETSLCRMDLQTLALDTLIAADGFFAEAIFSPDGKRILIKASPEFQNRIGCTLPEDKYPNQYDYQLYLMDVETKAIQPVTRDFNPSIENMKWSRYDNKIYFTALNKDRCFLYQLDPQTLKFTQVNLPVDYTLRFYLAENAPQIGVNGMGSVDFGKAFILNAKTLKAQLVEDIHQRELKDYDMPTVHEFNFTNSNGDEITGCYLLPPNFNPESGEKLPMIVYYYGGCSPSSRTFSTSYAFPALAAQGYVVYILQPRGAAGFSQEFGSWHVNTAGDPQTQDIIEGTNRICEALPFINRDRMGCMGASYGGFMTQYLQTKTDMFRCAISHAGISNHASYWGFGHWGYTYSQVSMSGKYPWTDKKLYVDNSPLFNVDKIKTPLLFLHGTADRNVPPIESSQMFTALRLLGKDAAYVTFQDEGHHIQSYQRKLNWQNTIQAWFAKYLKDDDSWWKALYKEEALY